MICSFSCFSCFVCIVCIVFIHTNNYRHQKFFFLFLFIFFFWFFSLFLVFLFFLKFAASCFAALQVYYTPACAENRPNFIPTFSTPSLWDASLSSKNLQYNLLLVHWCCVEFWIAFPLGGRWQNLWFWRMRGKIHL